MRFWKTKRVTFCLISFCFRIGAKKEGYISMLPAAEAQQKASKYNPLFLFQGLSFPHGNSTMHDGKTYCN